MRRDNRSSPPPNFAELSIEDQRELRDRTEMLLRAIAEPDVEAPFASLEDAVQRLLPYALFHADEDPAVDPAELQQQLARANANQARPAPA